VRKFQRSNVLGGGLVLTADDVAVRHERRGPRDDTLTDHTG
jgi:hypothetical protein